MLDMVDSLVLALKGHNPNLIATLQGCANRLAVEIEVMPIGMLWYLELY